MKGGSLIMKNALKDLVFLGHAEKVISLFGHEWKMKTIDASAQIAATASTGDYDTLARVNALKVAILARALISVDNEPVGNVGETAELLNKMQPMIINRLYDEYDNMISEQENALADLDELKNSSKTTSRESNTK